MASLFGSITQAHNVRNHLSLFWHRLLYKSFSAHANALLRLFGVSSHRSGSSPIAIMTIRLIKNTLIFAENTFMHAVVSWKLGTCCTFNRSTAFYCIQLVAFVIKGVIQHWWNAFKRKHERKLPLALKSVTEYVIGYLWVLC